jgi:hypothetical protein
MGDWHRLPDGLHERRMRLIVDLVVDHTSSEVRRLMPRKFTTGYLIPQHPWFQDSSNIKTVPSTIGISGEIQE